MARSKRRSAGPVWTNLRYPFCRIVAIADQNGELLKSLEDM